MTINILLVDDHAIVRDGLQSFLGAQPDLKVMGSAATGREAIQQVNKLCPDIVIMDITMPHLNGIEATRQIREVCPMTRVIVLSMHAAAEHIRRAFQAGAHGYVLKESGGMEVVNAIRVVNTGQRYLSQKIINVLVDTYEQPGILSPDPLTLLSTREREVMQLVVEGKSSAEIAQMLDLSPKTVDTYRSRLMQKLDINDLATLVKFAVQHGLTPLN